jgi:hypothetical protein
MADANASWQLEDFVDSLVVELDKTRETLAVKAINKPLNYTVRELGLDLNIFPSYDGDRISFVTAQPGQEGASKVTIQLGTITDQQVRATTKTPGTKNEITLAEAGLDKKTRKTLRKLGVTSDADVKNIVAKNVDIAKVSDDEIDYSQLANQIEKSRRSRTSPTVSSASLSLDEDKRVVLHIHGSNLAVNPKFRPVAVVNHVLADVVASGPDDLKLSIGREHRLEADNEIVVATDPFAVVRFKMKAQQI